MLTYKPLSVIKAPKDCLFLNLVMKIFGFIFSFYLLFLAIEPGISYLTHTEEIEAICCSSSSCEPIPEEQPEPKQGCDDTNTCNPFQSCSNNIVFISDPAFLDFSSVDIVSKSFTGIKDKVPPAITLDFWQPPKIA
jgi:hypothetical protein